MTADPNARRKHTARVAFVAGLLLAALGLGYYLADVLNPFLIALLIAYVLNPLVEELERRRVRRAFAVAVLFSTLLVGIGTSFVFGSFAAAEHLQDIKLELAGERVLDEKNDALKIAEYRASGDKRLKQDESGRYYYDEDDSGTRKIGLIERVTAAMAPRLRTIPQRWIESVARAAEAQAWDALAVGVQASRGVQAFLGHVWNFFGYVFLVPTYTFFLLLSLTDIQRTAKAHLPGLYRERIVAIASRIDRALAAFFRGRLLLGIGKGLFIWIGLWLVGVRFAFFVGLVAGVLSVVPFLGMIVGGLLAILFAYEPDAWGTRCVGVLVVFGAAEALEGAAFTYLVGRGVGIHPLSLILSIFCFGRIFGLFGVLLAVPIACVAKILFEEFALPEIKALAQEMPEDSAEASGPPK